MNCYKIDIFYNNIYHKQKIHTHTYTHINTKKYKKMNISIQIESDKDNKHSSASIAAYTESLKMILQHVADFHITVVDIISDKYKIPVDEIMNTVTSDSRYTNMIVNPKIHHFTSNIEIITSNTKSEVVEIKYDDVIKKQGVSESLISANKKKIKIKKIQI